MAYEAEARFRKLQVVGSSPTRGSSFSLPGRIVVGAFYQETSAGNKSASDHSLTALIVLAVQAFDDCPQPRFKSVP